MLTVRISIEFKFNLTLMVDIQILEQIRKMFPKNDAKRFNRSFAVPSSSSVHRASQGLLELGQPHRERAHDKSFSSSFFDGNGANVLIRLSEIERLLGEQRHERVQGQERMTRMIKEMQCKHSSIIYDSEIKYFKSPPKPEMFFYHNQKPSKAGLKKNSSQYCLLEREKENIDSSFNLKANKVLCSSKIETQANENPQKIYELGQKCPNLAHLIEEGIKRETQVLQQRIQAGINAAIRQLQASFGRERANLHQTLIRLESLQQNHFKNTYQMVQSFKQEVEESQSKPAAVPFSMDDCLKQIEERMKGLVIGHTFQTNGQFERIEKTYSEFKAAFQFKLEQICNILGFQSDQMNKMECFNQLNHNMYGNRLNEILHFVNGKLDYHEKERQRNEKYQQQVFKQIQKERSSRPTQSEKERQRVQIIKGIEESLNSKSESFRAMIHKQLQQRCQRVEESLMGVVERHIGYVEDYIRKNIEKEEQIISKYRDDPKLK